MTHYTHNTPYEKGVAFYEQNAYDPNRPPKKSRSSISKRAKKLQREVRSPKVESLKGYYPYGADARSVGHQPSPSSQAQPSASVSFSPQMPSASLPRASPPPPLSRPQQYSEDVNHAASAQLFLQALATYNGQSYASPPYLSRSSSLSSESSYSGGSRPSSLHSVGSTPPLSPYSVSSRLSTYSSSPSSSRHASPELLDYYAMYVDDKPVEPEYNRFLGTYHATLERGMHHRRH